MPRQLVRKNRKLLQKAKPDEPKRKLLRRRHTDKGVVRQDTYRRKDWPAPPKGRKDKRYPDSVLVALDDALDIYPPVYRPLCPPNTYYRVIKETGRPSCMVTIMPDDLRVAWFSCGACGALDIHLCRCQRGISAGRSLEYIYDQTVAKMAGEDWDMTHRNYSGSLRSAESERFTRKDLVMPIVGPTQVIHNAAAKPLLRRRKGNPAVPVPTMPEINAAASTDAASMADQARAALADTPVWRFDLDDWKSNVFQIDIPDDYDPGSEPVAKPKRTMRRKEEQAQPKRKLTRKKGR